MQRQSRNAGNRAGRRRQRGDGTEDGFERKKRRLAGQRLFPGILLAAGICMMLLGAARQEMQTVFQKAAAICMECIGIG